MACTKYPPYYVINKILLPAMKEVGIMFETKGLPLPYVLQSAEVMRQAIELLSPRLKTKEAIKKGTIILATVRGDVHDIGKNLVDIILSSNGYNVINLGVKQPTHSIIRAARENKADAIGLSGLLVSSTEIMREDLMTMAKHGITIPVLVGGAALTKKFTESVLQKSYKGNVFYCHDAFEGLRAMERIKR